MTDYKKYINALRKCAKEHENDRTFTGHVIVADLCRDTANLLEELEQVPILDKIRAEIRDWQIDIHDNEYDAEAYDYVFERIYEIIDEHKAGGEDKK